MELLARTYYFVFGVLTLLGGIVGFVRAKSGASLAAGTIGGILLVVSAGLIGFTSTPQGVAPALVLSALLAARFVPAYLETKKPMPAGLMAGLSVGGLLVGLGLLWLRW